MIIKVEPAEFFMHRVIMISNLENPDPEDQEIRDYMEAQELEPKYRSEGDEIGDGLLTILSDPSIWTSYQIDKNEHAYLLWLLSSEEVNGNWDGFVRDVSPTLEAKERPGWAKKLCFESGDEEAYVEMRKALAHLSHYLTKKGLQIPEDLDAYIKWAPEVGRFSFHWYPI